MSNMNKKYFHGIITDYYSFMVISVFLIISVGLSMGEHCSTDADCLPFKTFRACRSGVCQCKVVSYFDQRARTCKIFVGGSCTAAKGSEQCVDNAYCHTTGRYATQGGCECNKGYSETTEGLCVNGVPRIQLNQPIFFSLVLFSTFGLINYAIIS